MVVYDYDTPAGPVKAYYQTQTTNGSLAITRTSWATRGRCSSPSQKPTRPRCTGHQRSRLDPWVQKGYITAPKIQEVKEKDETAITDVRESVSPDSTSAIVLRDRITSRTCRTSSTRARKAKLNCPAEIATRAPSASQGQRGDRGQVPAVV